MIMKPDMLPITFYDVMKSGKLFTRRNKTKAALSTQIVANDRTAKYLLCRLPFNFCVVLPMTKVWSPLCRSTMNEFLKRQTFKQNSCDIFHWIVLCFWPLYIVRGYVCQRHFAYLFIQSMFVNANNEKRALVYGQCQVAGVSVENLVIKKSTLLTQSN